MISQKLSRLLQSDLSHTLVPLMDVERAGAKWLSTGDDPHMSVALDIKETGWYEFTTQIDMEYEQQAARLYFDYGHGYDEEDSIALPLTRNTLANRYFYLDAIPEKVRFDPQTSEGIFNVVKLMIRPIAADLDIQNIIIARLAGNHKRFQTLSREHIIDDITQLAERESVSWNSAAAAYYNKTYVDGIGSASSYPRWLDSIEARHNNEIEIIIKNRFIANPCISIIVPIYKPEPILLEKMIKSVVGQSYDNWQLCLVDDCSEDLKISNLLSKWSTSDTRIVYKIRSENGHISKASNDALSLAKGTYYALLDHDDELHTHALSHVVNAINVHPSAKVIYSDEDKLDDTENRYDPHFKSSWNRDLLYSQNYISHLGVYKSDLVDKVGGFKIGYEGSQDYDLLLRCIEHCKDDEIIHIPRVLYHWRATKGSTALSSDEKSYTGSAGVKALNAHFKREKQNVNVTPGMMPNTYQCTWQHLESQLPLVSLLIPTRDGVDLLDQCVSSILKKTTYPNFEIIILDNQSVKTATHQYFKKIQQDRRVRVIKYDSPFNFSGINNYGVTFARGEIIGLINNDIEIISAGWLCEMVAHAMRDDIGCVGAKLYFENDALQHGGVITGIGGVAGHSHKYADRKDAGYFCRLKLIQNLSAVTAAVLLIRKETYLIVGGLDESLGVAFNDVDFCLKVDQAGYRNLWTPYAELYHYESVSRGKDEFGEKRLRFDRETDYMRQKWGARLTNDPYYNENLTQIHENFELRRD